jgi:TolB-like protein
VQPSPDDVRAQLDRLLTSDGLANADRLKRFLSYVVQRTLDGAGDRLKEYLIGVEVFDRAEQYDPRVDSIVRVEAGRLRTKLDEYYNGAGAADAVIIRIPRGSYVPVFEHRPAPAPVLATAPSGPAPAAASTSRSAGLLSGSRLVAGVAAAAILLLAIAAWRTGIWATDDASRYGLTIAVLPFTTYSADPADQLLAARITDGVTGEMVRVGTLGVVSRTSAQQFTGERRPLREIARTLNAQILMEASLIAEGDSLRVSARLVDGELDRKVWVEEFSARRSEIPELQRRIAVTAAAAAIKARERR